MEFPTSIANMEEGEKRESGWTLFYATPVLTPDQEFRVLGRKIGVKYRLHSETTILGYPANFYYFPLEIKVVGGENMRLHEFHSNKL